MSRQGNQKCFKTRENFCPNFPFGHSADYFLGFACKFSRGLFIKFHGAPLVYSFKNRFALFAKVWERAAFAPSAGETKGEGCVILRHH
jgi:hypothetical protein